MKSNSFITKNTDIESLSPSHSDSHRRERIHIRTHTHVRTHVLVRAYRCVSMSMSLCVTAIEKTDNRIHATSTQTQQSTNNIAVVQSSISPAAAASSSFFAFGFIAVLSTTSIEFMFNVGVDSASAKATVYTYTSGEEMHTLTAPKNVNEMNLSQRSVVLIFHPKHVIQDLPFSIANR